MPTKTCKPWLSGVGVGLAYAGTAKKGPGLGPVFFFLLLLSLSGCSVSPGSTPSTPSPIAATSGPAPIAEATASPPQAEQELVFPAPLAFADGTPAQGSITPLDGFSDAGEFKLGLMRDLAPEHVKALIPMTGDQFNGTEVRWVPDQGLLLEAKPGPQKPPALKAGKPMMLTDGSLYFDGKGRLLILRGARTLPEEWHFVGQAILSKSLLDAVAAGKKPRITTIQGLAI